MPAGDGIALLTWELTGTYYWKDGSKYEGEWRHGKKHGKGKFTWPEVRASIASHRCETSS
jgi:hypothetical protein